MSQVGVILDSGGVLLRPITGQWFPPLAFYDVLSERCQRWDQSRLDEALELGEHYLDNVHAVPLADETAERQVWLRYYAILLEVLGVEDRAQLAELMTRHMEASVGVEPYPWTVPVLAELEQRGIPVVVLSDAWPSLRRGFRQLELDHYVKAMVISGEEGITKPDQRVFAKARDCLGDSVTSVYFVDDYPGHVRASCQLGMTGLRLRHPEAEPAAGLIEITDLRSLLAHL